MKMPWRGMRLLAVAFLAIACTLTIPGTVDRARADTNLVIGGDAVVAYANGDSVYVRSSGSYGGSILDALPEGSSVMVLDGPFADGAGSSWYYIEGGGTTGYMVADYLALSESSSSGSIVDYAMVIDGALNLRSGASTGSSVLAVMPDGAEVGITGSPQSGFYPVRYSGIDGFAFADFLSFDGGSNSNAGNAIVDYATVIDGALNLRAGASTGTSVLAVMPDGAEVGITGSTESGFYPVRYGGIDGYAWADYLSFDGGATTPASVIDTAVVIDGALNLRSGPGTSNAVLDVLPDGAEVGILGSVESGFYPVRYGSIDGYAYAEFLSFGATDPAPDPGPATVIDEAFTTTSLNLRAGSSTGTTVLAVMPSGAEIGILGDAEGNFYPVRFDGVDGFAAADYLTFDEPSTSPPPATGGSSIVWPVSGGTWEITQGYNGSSHYNGSSTYQYYYSFDLAREDRATAGQSVYAPSSGTVRWTERGSGGITIDMGNGYAVALFHLTVDRGWVAGDAINQGDYIGYISYPGGEGFAQFAHAHFSVWSSTDGGNWSRVAVPFSGQNAVSGQSFPDTGGSQQWTGTLFYP